MHEPAEDELNRVAEIFSLHPLAVEDALKAHQRPKLERYDDGLFLVLKTLWYVDEEDAVETGEINLFVGRNYVVSVRHGEGTELHGARLDLEQQTAVLGHGPSAVVYAICDRVVDEYESVATALEEDVDEVEASVFSPVRTQDSQRIYILKRELAEVRRAVAPAPRADEALRHRVGAVRDPGSRTVLPGRHRPRDPGDRGDRDAGHPAVDRVRRAPGADQRRSRTRTCGRSRPGSRSPPWAPWWPASTA